MATLNNTESSKSFAWVNGTDPVLKSILDQDTLTGMPRDDKRAAAIREEGNARLDAGIQNLLLTDMWQAQAAWEKRFGLELRILFAKRWTELNSELEPMMEFMRLLVTKARSIGLIGGRDYAIESMQEIVYDLREKRFEQVESLSDSETSPGTLHASEIAAIAVSDHDCPGVHD